MTSERGGSQVYSGPTTKSRAKALTYAEVTLQSSVTNLSQDRDQPKEQDEVTSPAFYDIGTLFHKDKLLAFIPQGQSSQDDQASDMLVLVTNSASLKEQMQELQMRLAEKEAEIVNLATCPENREH